MKKLLIAAVLFFSFSIAAYAAVTYTVGSIPVTTVVESGRTEKTGDIIFTSVPSSGATVTGTITIDYYPSPITYAGSVTSTATDGLTAPTIGTAVIENGTQLVFSVTPSATTPSANYYIRVTGVRVDVADDPGAVPMNAQISTTGNAITVGESTPRVINAARAGIASLTGGTPVTINSVTGAITSATNRASLDALENFRNAFGVTIASDPTQANTQQIKVRLDQALPYGLTVQFPATSDDGRWALIGTGTLTSASGANPSVYYQVNVDTDVTAVEHFKLSTITVTALSAAARGGAYPDVIIHATVSLAPIQAEGGASATARPRYNYVPVGNATIINFVHPTTTLLVPFAVNSTFVEGQPYYQTGLAIANTTVDPATMAVAQAVPQDGSFTIYLYANTGQSYSVSSQNLDQKGGLLVNGVLNHGKTYSILLNQVLEAAGAPEDFTGYIFIVTQFTNGHGEYFVFDGSNPPITNFTHGALMLVVNYDRNGSSEDLDN